ncbi:MAG: carboxypeptidase regulatory-like domain-containing protein [Gemmatimonas sp.]
MPSRRPLLLPLVALFALPASGLAQKPDGRLTGAVVDRTTSGPISAATVVFLGDGRAITTDSTGTFRFERLPSGILRFLVRAQGFPSFGLVLALAKGEALERRVELDSSAATAAALLAAPVKAEPASGAQALPLVSVAAAASLGPRLVNFERRRKTGSGQYLVRDDIERGGYSSLQDVARGMRGVTVDCAGGRGCQIRMVRAPMRCLPEYVVDDNVDNYFGPTIPVRDIEALEVYTGPADVPGEYAGRNAGCGVIVIWTRSGPPRRKKF